MILGLLVWIKLGALEPEAVWSDTPLVRAADEDDELRAAAFAFLTDLVARTGGLVRRRDLRTFSFEGRNLSLEQNMRGIRFIRGQPALSILTTFRERPEDRPYDDDIGPDGYPRYKWQGTNANAADNVSLRDAMELRKPLIWFFGVAAGAYEPIFPIWIVDEEPDQHQFVIALDDGMLSSWIPEALVSQPDLVLRREYANAVVRRRLHQPEFRRRVLDAYHRQCAMCQLRHPELLDAAHIREDAHGGEPIVTNGIAMCAIHHRAFDAHVVGVRTDYVIEVRADVLREHDGPTLQHTLQGMHGTSLWVPPRMSAQPSKVLLEERYERFRAAV